MPAIAFRVKSDRIQDIELPAGTTVGSFTRLLAIRGYDVKDASIRIRRNQERDTLIGSVASYRLKDADAVEFNTESIALPVANRRMHEQEIAEAAAAEARAVAQQKCSSSCKGECPVQDKRTAVSRIIIVVPAGVHVVG